MDSKFGECNDCLCFAARRAARGISQFYDTQLRSSGLRNTQFTLLSYLINAGRGPLTRAADYMGLERTSLSRNLQPLLAQGYISIDEGEDRRVKMIAITAKGRAKAEAALPLWRKAQQAMREKLPPSAAQALQAAARAA